MHRRCLTRSVVARCYSLCRVREGKKGAKNNISANDVMDCETFRLREPENALSNFVRAHDYSSTKEEKNACLRKATPQNLFRGVISVLYRELLEGAPSFTHIGQSMTAPEAATAREHMIPRPQAVRLVDPERSPLYSLLCDAWLAFMANARNLRIWAARSPFLAATCSMTQACFEHELRLVPGALLFAPYRILFFVTNANPHPYEVRSQQDPSFTGLSKWTAILPEAPASPLLQILAQMSMSTSIVPGLCPAPTSSDRYFLPPNVRMETTGHLVYEVGKAARVERELLGQSTTLLLFVCTIPSEGLPPGRQRFLFIYSFAPEPRCGVSFYFESDTGEMRPPSGWTACSPQHKATVESGGTVPITNGEYWAARLVMAENGSEASIASVVQAKRQRPNIRE